MGDRVLLQQVVINLISNAVHAVERTPSERRLVTVTTSASDEAVAVAVTDNGPGFPDHLREDAFRAFCSTKRSGMGLGLAISQSTMLAHGGCLRADDAPDGGAIVSFTLPRHGEASPAAHGIAMSRPRGV